MNSAAKILSGPAGYAVPLLVGGLALYVLFKMLKAPAAAAYQGAQNFDQNVGLGGFDEWVSNLFSAPVGAPNADLGGTNFGANSPGW